jgi:hypothetical protein
MHLIQNGVEISYALTARPTSLVRIPIRTQPNSVRIFSPLMQKFGWSRGRATCFCNWRTTAGDP